MNKRVWVIIFILGILLLSFIAKQVSSEEGDIPTDKDTEKIVNLTEHLSEEDSRNEYLKQEWTKILEKSKIGKVLLGIFAIFKALSPVFKVLIGIEYSLSWLFFLSFGFWIAIVIIIYKPAKCVFQAKWWIALPIALIVSTFAARAGIISKTVDLFVPLFTNYWIIIIAIFIAIILMIVYSKFMKSLGKKMEEKMKKENEERREIKAQTVEKINDLEIKSNTP